MEKQYTMLNGVLFLVAWFLSNATDSVEAKPHLTVDEELRATFLRKRISRSGGKLKMVCFELRA